MKVRKFASVLLVLLLLLSLTACGAASKDTAMEMPMEMAPNSAAGDMFYGDSAEMDAELKTESSTSGALPADRKLIRTIGIDAETEDLAALLDNLNARVTQLGGYVEAKNLRNGSNYGGYTRRTLSMTVRIPAAEVDEFVRQVSENANVVSSAETVDDVTLQYVDTESHVKALETEQARLIELLEQAKDLEDILKIEDRLTDVRYELERYASFLRTLENQVSYATVNLNITEVKEYTPIIEEEPTMWQRIATGFARSIKDIGKGLKEFFIWVVVNSPYLLIWGGIGTATVILLRKRKSKKQKKILPPDNKE